MSFAKIKELKIYLNKMKNWMTILARSSKRVCEPHWGRIFFFLNVIENKKYIYIHRIWE